MLYCIYYGTECDGHHPWDLTAYQSSWKNASDGTFVVSYLTNAEILGKSRMDDYQLPYIYEDFEWSHCDESGVYFGTEADVKL